MRKNSIVLFIAALLAFGGCGTKRDDSQAEGSAAAQREKRPGKAEREAKKRAEDEARAKEAIAKLQTADEPALLAALGDQDRRVRRAALQLLADKGAAGEPVIQAVLPLLVDHWKPVREAARQLLIRIGEPAVAPLIAVMAKNSRLGGLSAPASRKGRKPLTIRVAIKETLGEMGEIPVPALIEALSNPDEFIRRNASGALGRIGEKAKAAVPVLLEAHEKDEDATVRMNALGDLGLIAPLDPKVEALARKAESSEDERLRKTAAKVLEWVEQAKADKTGKVEPSAAPAAPAPAAKQ